MKTIASFLVFLLLVFAAAKFTGGKAAEAAAPTKPGLFQQLQESRRALDELSKR